MYKILFSILIFVSFLGYGQDISGTGWKIYDDDGDRRIVLFEEDGTFTFMRTQSVVWSDSDDTWKLDGDKITMLYSDGYRILSGTINKERDYMSGTSINREGYTDNWYGTLIKF